MLKNIVVVMKLIRIISWLLFETRCVLIRVVRANNCYFWRYSDNQKWSTMVIFVEFVGRLIVFDFTSITSRLFKVKVLVNIWLNRWRDWTKILIFTLIFPPSGEQPEQRILANKQNN